MTHRIGTALAMFALMLAGCSTPAEGPHTWGASYDYGTPGAVASATAGVAYYPACGNEILTFDGTTWYPFTPSNLDESPTPSTRAMGAPRGGGGPGALGMSLPLVVAPSPGDDVGTLVVYHNGLAHWRADSGKRATWLTTREITYNWAC